MKVRRLAVPITLVVSGCGGADDSPRPTPLQRELLELPDSMEDIHPNLLHDVQRAEFRAAAQQLADAARGLTHDELVVGLMRLTALPGPRDGHTGVFPFHDHARPLHLYPLRLYEFPDGLYVVAPFSADEFGRRLTAIEGQPVDELIELVRPLVPHDNESSLRAQLPSYLVTAEVLRGLGVTRRGAASFSFADGSTAKLNALPAGEVFLELGFTFGPIPRVHDSPFWAAFVRRNG